VRELQVECSKVRAIARTGPILVPRVTVQLAADETIAARSNEAIVMAAHGAAAAGRHINDAAVLCTFAGLLADPQANNAALDLATSRLNMPSSVDGILIEVTFSRSSRIHRGLNVAPVHGDIDQRAVCRQAVS
jgi:hypothetical protein